MSLLSFFHSWAVANMLTFCSSTTDSCPLSTEILINFMSCCFHKKIKIHGVFLITYVTLLNIFLILANLFWLGINENWIFYLQFYLSDDWKNFPQTKFWLHKFLFFLLHYPHTTGFGHHKTQLFWREPLALNCAPTSLSDWHQDNSSIPESYSFTDNHIIVWQWHK